MLIILQVGFRENYNNLWRVSITICLQLSYKKIIEEILRRIINNEEMKLNEFKKRIITTGYNWNMTIWVVNKKLRNSSDFEAAKRENWNHQIFINNSSFFESMISEHMLLALKLHCEEELKKWVVSIFEILFSSNFGRKLWVLLKLVWQ